MQRITLHLRHATRGLAVLVFLLSATISLRTAQADTNDVYQLNCSTCVHLADFVNAAVSQATIWTDRTQGEGDGLFSGMYFVSATNAPLTALVDVTETAYPPSNHLGYWHVRTISGKAVKPDGTAMTSDADLDSVDGLIYSTYRRSEIGPVHVPPQYGVSYAKDTLIYRPDTMPCPTE